MMKTHAAPLRMGRVGPGPVRPRLVVVDMAVIAASPAGSCVLAEVRGLAVGFDVTVLSDRFDAAGLPGVEFIRVPAPDRPVLLRYLVFHGLVRAHYLRWRWRGGRAEAVQATQGQLQGADICYAHFCHAAYLKGAWRIAHGGGLRRWARWATHRFNAACEAGAIRRARVVVVPSEGLAGELSRCYPACKERIRVIPNPVDLAHFQRPTGLCREAQREQLGLVGPGDRAGLLLGFMALGDFERKGLGLLLRALAKLPTPQRRGLSLLVIGGSAGEVAEFEQRATALGLAERVRFVGLQHDVRPFLWACDAFALASAYESFGLAGVQAAAAGLPVMVCDTACAGAEFVVDGVTGWSVARDEASIVVWYARLLVERDRLGAMQAAAAASVRQFGLPLFQLRWRTLLETVVDGAAVSAVTPDSTR